MSQIRSDVSEAMSTLDESRITDALLDGLRRLFQPAVIVGLTLVPGHPLRVMRLVCDDHFRERWSEALDFSWMEPILGADAPNGATTLGPDLFGVTQMAAAMTTGDGRYGYILMAGAFDDSEFTRGRFAAFARESGESFAAIMKANERAADLATMRERERLSRDLHDSLSQSLWSLSMLSETAQAGIDSDDPLHKTIRQISEISLTSQEEMRALLINLRSVEPVAETLGGSLESLIADFRSVNDVDVVASIADAEADPAEAMAFRRIAEEALNNVVRHAKASRVVVVLDQHPALTLRIIDDGVGFDAGPREGHLGLRIMEERATSVGCEFDVSSGVTGGTVVTVSQDLSTVSSLPAARAAPPLPRSRETIRPLIACLMCFVAAMGSFAISRSVAADAASRQADADQLIVLEQSVFVARASVDEATSRLLEAVGETDRDDVARAAAQRELVLISSMQRIEPLGEEGSVRALELLDELHGLAALGQSESRIPVLLAGARAMEPPAVGTRPGGDPAGVGAGLSALTDLAALDQALAFGLHEALAARYVMGEFPVVASSDVEDYLAELSDTVRVAGGFLGPNPAAPLRDGFFPVDPASVHERGALAELNQIVVDAALWDDDQWLWTWDMDAGPPPSELSDLVDRTESAATAMRAVVDNRISDEQAELVAAVDGLDRWSRVMAIAALGLGGLAVLGLFRAVKAARARAVAIEQSRSIDSLTGVGNRRRFEETAASYLGDPALEHHAVVMIDMDRFKFITDVHGRELGDRMLDTVAIGLGVMRRRSESVKGALGRLGGDEFVVSFHSAERLPIEVIHGAFDRLRSTQVSAPDGSLVRCSFSYGVSLVEGSSDLRSMMVDAELRLYEAKSRLKA